MSRCSRAVLVGGLLFVQCTAAALSERLRAQAPESLDAFEQALVRRLPAGDAALARAQLNQDRRALALAIPAIAAALPLRGYSQEDAAAAGAWAWFWLRAGEHAVPLSRPLTPSEIQAKAEKQGKLHVNSNPDRAAIFIDNVEAPGDTNRPLWADVGQRRVRVNKSGLEPAQQVCNVNRERTVTFVGTLRAAGSEATCS